MDLALVPRYTAITSFTREASREVCLAEDRLSGRHVILKTDELPNVIRELRVLLALPRGLGPEVLDVAWSSAGTLIMVLEYLPGQTLQQAARRGTVERVPELAHAITQALVHLHRTGVVHVDLKPQNIQILDDPDGYDVRLLDFGFALGRFADPRDDEEDRGGTPPYLAPEVSQGWMVDGRADLYSLGVLLKELLFGSAPDVRWNPILDRLSQAAPALRYPHAIALRNEMETIFGLSPSPARLLTLGGGPMRGREELFRRVHDLLAKKPGTGILIQARQGIGLTRFLLEAVLEVAARGGPPVCALDLGGLGPDMDGDAITTFVDGRRGEGEAILCGVPDPSPGLWWLPTQVARWLRRMTTTGSWERLVLPSLETESLVEIVADNLDSGSAAAAEIVNVLQERAEGDLRSAARTFGFCLDHGGAETAEGWALDREVIRKALAEAKAERIEPALASISTSLVAALTICARIGTSFSRDIVAALLSLLGRGEDLVALVDHGYLEPSAGGRLGFVTKSLWREAAAADCPQYAQINIWLNENLVPDPSLVEEVIAACLRARRLKDRPREAAHLSRAFERAHSERRWSDLRRLLAYPEDPPPQWTADFVLRRVGALQDLLGASWSKGQIQYIAAESMRRLDHSLCTELAKRVAEDTDTRVAADALILLLDGMAGHADHPEYATFIAALERLESGSANVPPGTLSFFRARQAIAQGHVSLAESLAVDAVEKLRGSGLLQEVPSLQLLAAIQFPKRPPAAIRSMKMALAAEKNPELLAQARYNLTRMYGQTGDLGRAVRCANDGISALAGRISSSRLIGLRVQRAWMWAELDRIDPAWREARDLLNLAEVREDPNQLTTVKLLLGYCYLHHLSSPDAIRETAQAWMQSSQGCELLLRFECLRCLLDILLDLKAWDTAREHGGVLKADFEGNDPGTLTTVARAEALRAQCEGRLQDAVMLLEAHLAAGESLSAGIAAARYVHHLGLLRLLQSEQEDREGQGRAAADLFDKELEILPKVGHGYYRSRALLGLGTALVQARERDRAERVLGEAESVAKRISSRRLFVECSHALSRLQLEG